jgi:filamentous hemagglutinin family protein
VNTAIRRTKRPVTKLTGFSRGTRAKAAILCAIAPIAGVLSPVRGGVQFTGTSAGTASVSQNGSVTNIRTSNNAILNFSQFDIARGSTVNFIQPNAASRELNRINSATPSMINGAIVSNGAVYMINPAGVIFGGGATIDVNRIVVAGSHLSDSDFLSGVDHFTGVSGLVSNAGSIHANQGAILIGSEVVNTGSIVSPGGVVAMLSGSDVFLSQTGSHVAAKIIPAASVSTTLGGSSVSASKDLSSSALAAGDPYALAIHHSGTIQATNVLIDGGKGNVQISGAINANTSTTGGNVAITGGNVDVASATITASGPSGGGTIQIGGGSRGTGDLAHADSVSADGNTVINADATSSGDGGSIVLFSDGTTTSSATLTARGGPLGGNGGLIETSGKFAQITRAPDESAPNGSLGTWLLDPLNVDIVLGANNGILTGSATVTNGSIVTGLGSGNVIITTNQAGTDPGTLTQDANAPINVTLGAPATLQLEGTTAVSLHGGITATSGSALSVVIDVTSSSSAPLTIDTNPINVNGSLAILGGNITTTPALTAKGVQLGTGTAGATGVVSSTLSIQGSITTSGPFVAVSSAFTNTGAISDAAPTTAGQVFSINTVAGGGSGNINIDAPVTWTASGTTRTITMEAGGSVVIGAGGSVTGSGTVPVALYSTGSTSNNVELTGSVNTGGAFVAAGGSFLVDSSASTVLTAQSVSLNIQTTAVQGDGHALTNGSVSIGGPVNVTGSGAAGPFLAGGTSLFINNNNGIITTNKGPVTVTNTGVDTIGEPITTNTTSSGGAISFTGGSQVTTSATVTAGGNVTFSATGPVSVGAAVSSNGGTIALSSSSSSVSTGGTMNTGGGSFNVVGTGFTSSGPITDGGVATAAHSLTINTAEGTGGVSISSPITWAGTSAGGGGADPITIEANGAINLANADPNDIIQQTNIGTGSVPVSIYDISPTGAVTENGVVDIGGAFTSGGGSFTLGSSTSPNAAFITAASASISTVTHAPDGSLLTNGSVFIQAGIIATSLQGSVLIGGSTILTDNTNGFITTNAGAVTFSNTGQQILGEPITTSGSAGGPVGGNFTATGGTSFVTGQAGSITTGGGNVLISTTGAEGSQIDAPIHTGGGAFNILGQAFTDQGLITDDGIVLAGEPSASAKVDMTQNNGTGDINGVTITWQGGPGRSVVIQGGGNVTVNNVTATGPTALPLSVFSTNPNDAVNLSGPINITGQFLTSGGNFNVEQIGSLTAASVAVGTVTVLPGGTQTLTSGSTSFSGAVSTTGNITITSAGFTNTGAVSTGGGVLAATTTGNITVQGPITTSGGAVNLSSGAAYVNNGSGTITSGGGSVALHGSTTASIDAAVNTGGGNFSATGGGVENSAEISDGGINDSQPQGFQMAATGANVNVSGPISWAASFSPITFSVPLGGTVILASSITANAAEPVNFSGVPVALSATSTITGGSITLGAITDASSGANPELIIQSSGAVSLQAVGTTAAPIGGIRVLANNNVNPTTTLNGDINVNGDAVFTGTVNVPATVNITSTSTNQSDHGDLEFNGNIEGPGGLNLNSLFQMRINGNVGNVSPLAFLDFTCGPNTVVFFSAGPAGQTGIQLPGVLEPQPAVEVDIASGGNLKVNDKSPNTVIGDQFASIAAYGPVTINFGKGAAANAANLYAVGENEKFSIHGSLNINANGGTVQTGDISTTSNLSIEASTIIFMGRLGQVSSSGQALDTGMDLISGGQLALPGTATYIVNKGSTGQGNLDTPVFIAQSYSISTGVGALTSLLHSTFSVIGGIDPAVMFGSNNLLLDLTPATLSVTVPKFVPPIPFVYEYPIAGPFPPNSLIAPSVPTDFKTAFEPVYPGPIVQQRLKDDGVFTRDPNTEEILGAVGPMALYNDMPGKPRPHASDYKVVVNRLDYRRSDAYLEQCRQVFGDNPAARRAHMAGDIQTAWDAYVTQNGEQPATGEGFAKFCATTPSAAPAYRDLQQLHGIRTSLGESGMSHKEQQVAFQYNVLGGMSANGMREGVLPVAVANVSSPH